MFGTKKRIAIAASLLVVVIGASAAFAYWTQGGSGTGSASAGTTTAISVYQTNTVTGLYPGGPAVALSGDFINPNPGSVTVDHITASVHAFTTSFANGLPECTDADFTIGGTSGPYVVPTSPTPTTHVGAWSGLTVQMVNDLANNQDNCKNANIQIDYVAHALP